MQKQHKYSPQKTNNTLFGGIIANNAPDAMHYNYNLPLT